MEQVSNLTKISFASIAVRAIMHHTHFCVLTVPDSNIQEHILYISFNMTSKPLLSLFPRFSVKYPPTLSPLPGHRGCVVLETHVEHQRFSARIETNMRKVVGSKHNPETQRNTMTNMATVVMSTALTHTRTHRAEERGT